MHGAVVIGAGPVGAFSAACLEKGMDLVVLERERGLGHKACSGLISTGLDKFVKPRNEWIDSKVKGAVMHSPGGKELVLKKKGTAAYVIDRPAFDRWVASRVKSDIMFSTEARAVDVKKDHVEVRTNKGTVKARLLVDCSGAMSIGARKLGARPEEMLNGLTAIVDKPDSGDFVEMWFDRKKLADGFLWRIPRGDSVEYGAIGKSVNFRQLESFFKIRDYKKGAAPIPMGLVKTFGERMLLIGDSACQVKPWSGGGIIYGFTAAGIAADVVKKASGNYEESVLETYETGWRSSFGRNISLGMLMRAMFKEMKNSDIDRLFDKVGKSGALDSLDMDFPLFSKLPF
jgi:geranylgeranyl reductase family protein